MVKFGKVQTFQCENKGRGLQAIEAIVPGEELLVEKPLVYTLINGKTRDCRCDYCFQESPSLLRCSRCKSVSYCNKGCQKDDWSLHKLECKCLVKVAPRNPPDIVRLISQILFRCSGKNEVTNKEFRTSIESLVSNEALTSQSRKEHFFTFGAVLSEYIQDTSVVLQDFDIYGLFCRISCNSFTITNSELNSVGTGIFKVSSLINHSCDPNCIAIFDGPNISIRSITEIAPGEELFLTYVSVTSPVEMRQADLREGYMFTCTCHICIAQQFNDSQMKSFRCASCPCHLHVVCLAKGASQLDSSSIRGCSCDKPCKVGEEQLREVNLCMNELDSLYNSINVIPTSDQQKLLKRWIDRSEKVLGVSNISLVRCYEVAMDGCLDVNDWQGALNYGKKLEKPYSMYHSRFHPTIGLHFFKLGKLELMVDNIRGGISCFQKSMKVLTKSHGEKHELVIYLRQALDNACNDLAEVEKFKVHQRVYDEMEG